MATENDGDNSKKKDKKDKKKGDKKDKSGKDGKEHKDKKEKKEKRLQSEVQQPQQEQPHEKKSFTWDFSEPIPDILADTNKRPKIETESGANTKREIGELWPPAFEPMEPLNTTVAWGDDISSRIVEEKGVVSFWGEFEKMIGESVGRLGKYSIDQPIVEPEDDGAGVLQVPEESAAELGRKQSQIELVTGASLELNGTVLKITGPKTGRPQAERYARAVITKRSDLDEHPDLALVAVSSDWAKSWHGEETKLEQETHTLIFFEDASSKRVTRYYTNQFIEARWGNTNKWYLAVVLGSYMRTKVRIKWCLDGSTDEVNTTETRPAPRIGIFGSRVARLGAEVRIMMMHEEKAYGSIAAKLEFARPSSGFSMGYTDLMVRPGTLWKLQQNDYLKYALHASGCIMVSFFMYPKTAARADRLDAPCALLAGTREQRWLAGSMLTAYAAGLDMNPLVELPAHLVGECRSIKIPEDLRSTFEGKYLSNVKKMMESTGTFMFALKEKKGQPLAKMEDELDQLPDFLSLMLDRVRRGASREVVIFGKPQAQFSAQIKIMAMIEDKYNGFYCRKEGSSEDIDPAEGLAVDRIWLSEDFEDSSLRVHAEILEGASGCSVESAGKLVFLASTQERRTRGREYLHFMTSWLHKKKVMIPDVESRKDALQLKVPTEVIDSSWLGEQLRKLAKETKTLIFFDSWRCQVDEERMGRIILLGEVLVQAGEADDDIIDKAGEDIIDKKGDNIIHKVGDDIIRKLHVLVWKDLSWKNAGRADTWWKSVAPDDEGKDEVEAEPDLTGEQLLALVDNDDGNDIDQSDTQHKKILRAVPQTPGFNVQDFSAAVPRTPAFGVSMPRTPATVAAPRTPAGPGSVPMPRTPAGPGSVPMPRTPAGPVGVAMPQTPAGPAGLAMPQTPAGPVGAAMPQTPAGPGGVQVPMTPAGPGGTMAPQTPAPPTCQPQISMPIVDQEGFRGAPPPKQAMVGVDEEPKSKRFRGAPPPKQAQVAAAVAMPKTPALSTGVAMPKTPAPSVGVAMPQTPAPAAGVAMPKTPAPAAGVAMPKTPALGSWSRAGVPMPQTPALGVPMPQTPALVGARPPSTARVGESDGVIPPQTPALTAVRPSLAAPQTPASFLQAPSGNTKIAAPMTPAVLGGGGNIVPMTPAGPGGIDRGTLAPQTPALGTIAPQTPAVPSAPQTPAFIANSRSMVPATPAFTSAGGTAPRTPAGKASSRGAPSTPATISSASRPVPQTPAAMNGGQTLRRSAVPATPAAILVSGPPSPTAAPPSRAPMPMEPEKPVVKNKPSVLSNFMPKKYTPDDNTKKEVEDDVEEKVPELHVSMSYSEWVNAKKCQAEAATETIAKKEE